MALVFQEKTKMFCFIYNLWSVFCGKSSKCKFISNTNCVDFRQALSILTKVNYHWSKFAFVIHTHLNSMMFHTWLQSFFDYTFLIFLFRIFLKKGVYEIPISCSHRCMWSLETLKSCRWAIKIMHAALHSRIYWDE